MSAAIALPEGEHPGIALARLLNPDGPLNLVAFASRGSGPEACPYDDDAGILRWIETRQGERWNIYYHAAASKVRRTKLRKVNVEYCRAVWVDLDPNGGDDFEPSRQRMLDELMNTRLTPSTIIDTGNGFQALWMLDEPYMVNGDAERIREFERRTYGLYLDFEGTGGDGCWSIDHLLRLPSCINFLTKKKEEEKGYPKGDRPARIIFTAEEEQ